MTPSRSNRQKAFGLIGLLLVTFAAPAVSAFIPMSGDWYQSLQKPSWNPPSWLFGPVWSTLYTLMALAAWLVWLRTSVTRPLVPYFVQLVLNAAWTPVFFAAHRLDLALGIIVSLWIIIWVTMIGFFRVRAAAGWLFVPYLLWVSFATALNAALWRMNN